jgi:hypothetical protein
MRPPSAWADHPLKIPYTIIKFVAFERIAEAIYNMLPKPKSQMSLAEQMVVIFTSGYADLCHPHSQKIHISSILVFVRKTPCAIHLFGS